MPLFRWALKPILKVVLIRTARVALPVFALYTAFTVVMERAGFDSVNNALAWPSVILYVLPGFVAARHVTFRRAVLVGVLLGVVFTCSGIALQLAGAFEPTYPAPSIKVVGYSLAGGLLFSAAGSVLGAFMQRRFAARGRQHPI